jgi:hypothetical protein
MGHYQRLLYEQDNLILKAYFLYCATHYLQVYCAVWHPPVATLFEAEENKEL